MRVLAAKVTVLMVVLHSTAFALESVDALRDNLLSQRKMIQSISVNANWNESQILVAKDRIGRMKKRLEYGEELKEWTYDGNATFESFTREGQYYVAVRDSFIATRFARQFSTPYRSTIENALAVLDQAINSSTTAAISNGTENTEVKVVQDDRTNTISFDQASGMPRQITIETKQGKTVITAEYKNWGGVWYPMSGGIRSTDANGELIEDGIVSFKVTDLRLNAQLPDSMFQTVTPKSAVVVDERFGCSWRNEQPAIPDIAIGDIPSDETSSRFSSVWFIAGISLCWLGEFMTSKTRQTDGVNNDN